MAPQAVVRTALCVEARHGTLHVFMPPVGQVEDYLRLVAAVEATAEELAMPVRIEGYPPPHDYRLQHFKVTPDPGVIEVNLQPARKWDELVHNTTTLYDEARLARLGTEKFMLDGRHTGTGGGNHLVLGGRHAARKPVFASSRFVAQPDCLLEQPAIAVVLVFRFVHRARPARRRGVDEARHEAVYELETAFTQLPLQRRAISLDRRSCAAEFAGRRDRQHAPGRILHRQAVFARFRHGPPGIGRVSRLRDAAPCADELDAATADAGIGCPLLEPAVSRAAGALGHVAARPIHVAALCVAGFSGSAGRIAGGRLSRWSRIGSRRISNFAFRFSAR